MKRLLFFILLVLPTELLAQEICNNGIDDDGDGLADLNDPDCTCYGIEIEHITSLIPNPSFEDTLCCPVGLAQMSCATSWMQASFATTDYLNLCSRVTYLSPLPLPGGGSGYVGFLNRHPNNSMAWQEYAGACLNSPVLTGEDYQLRFFLSRNYGRDTIIVAIFGTPDCNADLPWSSTTCPIGSGSWIELGRDTVISSDSTWQPVYISFSAPMDIHAVAIGSACDLISINERIWDSYYYLDELTLATVAAFNQGTVVEAGKWCTNDLRLQAHIDTVGGSWQWYRDGVALLGETADSLDLMSYGTEGLYTAVYRLNGDCVRINHVVDTTDPANQQPPEVQVLNSDTTVCQGGVIAVTAVADSSAYSYQWSPSAGISDPHSLTPEITVEVDSSVFYELIASYPGCPDLVMDGFWVHSFAAVEVNLGEDTVACQGDTVFLTASVQPYRPDYQYAWTPISGLQFTHTPDNYFLADSSITYQLKVSTPIGCMGMDSIHIEVQPTDFTLLNADTILCKGDTLSIEAIGSEGYTYQWSPSIGVSDTQALEPYIIATASHTYTLSATHPKCDDTSQSFTLTVDTPYQASFTLDPQEVCIGQPVYFYPISDLTATAASWTFDQQSRLEVQVNQAYQHAFEHPGAHPVTLQAHFRACPDTRYTDSITVYPLPEVDLGGDSSICLHGAPVYLKNLREAPLNPHHYLWSTGDTTATLKVVHPGTYTLRVTTEPIGCTTTESIEITKDCYIDIPNAFTPNGDGHNDYFFPRQLLSESISRFRMQVFNRWGQLIFETTNLNGRGWDGRFNDKAQSVGVYLYRIEVGFTNDREEQYEGNVTLVR